jgi:hypothetical protein
MVRLQAASSTTAAVTIGWDRREGSENIGIDVGVRLRAAWIGAGAEESWGKGSAGRAPGVRGRHDCDAEIRLAAALVTHDIGPFRPMARHPCVAVLLSRNSGSHAFPEYCMPLPSFSRRSLRTMAVLSAGAAALVIGQRVYASDHQDTPETELNPRMDINDVYAFPGSSADRIALVVTTSSPIAGQSASFDPNLLYQIKVDNTGDAVEDLVFQITFDNGVGAAQKYQIRGPVAPPMTGTKTMIATSGTVVQGTVGTTSGSATGVQAFAGLRADPFVIDLEQFFNIIPDRRPSTGPLAVQTTAPASSFRTPGIDFLKPFNALAIAIELPKSALQSSTAADAKFGVWSTISR